MDPNGALMGLYCIVVGILSCGILAVIGFAIYAAVGSRHDFGKWIFQGDLTWQKMISIPVWLSLHVMAVVGWIIVGILVISAANDIRKFLNRR